VAWGSFWDRRVGRFCVCRVCLSFVEETVGVEGTTGVVSCRRRFDGSCTVTERCCDSQDGRLRQHRFYSILRIVCRITMSSCHVVSQCPSVPRNSTSTFTWGLPDVLPASASMGLTLHVINHLNLFANNFRSSTMSNKLAPQPWSNSPCNNHDTHCHTLDCGHIVFSSSSSSNKSACSPNCIHAVYFQKPQLPLSSLKNTSLSPFICPQCVETCVRLDYDSMLQKH
jgi:hypothetical protein